MQPIALNCKAEIQTGFSFLSGRRFFLEEALFFFFKGAWVSRQKL